METNSNDEQIKTVETDPVMDNNAVSTEPPQENISEEVVKKEETPQNEEISTTPIPMTMTPVENQSTEPVQEQPKKKKNGCLIAIIIVVIVLLLVGGCTAAGIGILVHKTKSIIKEAEDMVNNTEIPDFNDYSDDEEDNSGVGETEKKLNVIVAGHVDHGQEKLIIELSKKYNGKLGDSDLGRCPELKDNSLPINVQKTTIETDDREYHLSYACNHSDTVKTLITTDYSKDGAIVVISAVEGPMPQTIEYLRILNEIGVSRVVIFMNNCDKVTDKKELDTVEDKIKILLGEYNFDENKTPIVRGSLDNIDDSMWEDQLDDLIEAADKWLVNPQSNESKDFLMPVEDVFSMTGRGTIVTGRVESGKIEANERVEIIGLNSTKEATIASIEMFQKELDSAKAGDSVGLLLNGVEKSNIEKGQVIVKKGTMKAYKKYEASVYMYTKEENGREAPYVNGFKPQFYFRTADINGTITLPDGIEMVMPGDNLMLTVELEKSVAMKKGTRFLIRENGKTIGAGVIVKTIS